jgi:hypothetical protein
MGGLLVSHSLYPMTSLLCTPDGRLIGVQRHRNDTKIPVDGKFLHPRVGTNSMAKSVHMISSGRILLTQQIISRYRARQ